MPSEQDARKLRGIKNDLRVNPWSDNDYRQGDSGRMAQLKFHIELLGGPYRAADYPVSMCFINREIRKELARVQQS